MAIYHLEAKVVSRGTGRSAVAASAYMSCSRLYNDYDGIQHDYTRKQGLVWEHIFLPDYAPAAWQEREALWNAVEENEKAKDNRLARELVVALPVELDTEKQIALLAEYVQNDFVADGMCADAAIHDTDGHNPHAHILLTVRPLNEDGTWQYKTEKEYLCIKAGEERGFTAAEYKAAQNDGWEKQYLYKVGKRKAYLPPSEAAKYSYARVDKHPKSTRFGRQNPISERWNSEDQLVLWREAWAETVNRVLERDGHDTRINHRSHAARGLDEQPTVHEGVIARLMEREGMVSDRCELNRQIRADNRLLRELKARVKKLTEAVRNTIPAIAEALERLRANMLILRYQVLYIWRGKERVSGALKALQPEYERYMGLVRQVRETSKERSALLSEKKETPALLILKHRDLSRRISELTEKLEELNSEKTLLLASLEYTEDIAAGAFRKDIAAMETSLQKLTQQEQKYKTELDHALQEYAGIQEQAHGLDPVALYEARQALRTENEQDAICRVQAAYGKDYDRSVMRDSRADVSKMLHEEAETRSVREHLRQLQRENQPKQRASKERHMDMER